MGLGEAEWQTILIGRIAFPVTGTPDITRAPQLSNPLPCALRDAD